jgi:hypothetical protein
MTDCIAQLVVQLSSSFQRPLGPAPRGRRGQSRALHAGAGAGHVRVQTRAHFVHVTCRYRA